MKNHILSALAISLITYYFALNTCKAQAPQGIPYQAIARNASGVAITNTAVKVRFSIRDSIATGPVRYQETHSPTTSALGLFSVNVGMGTVVSGTFSGINWGKNAKFLQVELDPAGGNTYTDLGTTQMMSVPYALYAGNANNANSTGGNSYVASSRIGFSSSTVWTCPAGVTQITVELWGGGGGGGSSSGCVYRWNGNKCFLTRNGGWGYITGVAGGNGGKGGYNKGSFNVVPGTTYDVQIGIGGSGGIGGCSVAVNSGTAGQSGGISYFKTNELVLLQAAGGSGGTSGQVACSCPNQNGTNLINCGGAVPGANGTSALVLNYISPINSVTLPSYISTNYLTPNSNCCAKSGSGGVANSNISGETGCVVSNVGDNNYPLVEFAPNPGEPGEGGFCVISY